MSLQLIRPTSWHLCCRPSGRNVGNGSVMAEVGWESDIGIALNERSSVNIAVNKG